MRWRLSNIGRNNLYSTQSKILVLLFLAWVQLLENYLVRQLPTRSYVNVSVFYSE